VIFRQRNQKIETFSAGRTDDPSTEAVSLGTSRWRFEYTQSHVCNGLVERGRENAIAVMDEKMVAMVRGDGFSQLLECPRRGGVGCHIAVRNPSGLVFDND
jgi:hypothetical protein